MGSIQDETDLYEDAKIEAQRLELDWLLASGALGRSGNVARVLKYVCEEHFAGRAHLIKEYVIATEALGRRSDFDPNADTIVRVTFHSLRKRLNEVYQKEGSDRQMRLVLPQGSYAPIFIPAPETQSNPLVLPSIEANASENVVLDTTQPAVFVGSVPLHATSRRFSPWTLSVAALCLVTAICLAVVFRQKVSGPPETDAEDANATMPLPAPQATIRALLGNSRKSIVDHSGLEWKAANYCQQASSVSVPPQKIRGTLDSEIYLVGVRGIVHCKFPVTQKLYELHLHFAETSDLPPATRVASLSINTGPGVVVDVVNDAGGDGIATSTVVTGVVPASDGLIHLDFTSEVSPLNAVELLPAPSLSLLPVRIAATTRSVVDADHQLWMADHYYSGGRFNFVKHGALGLYEAGRIGSFRYSIPVVPSERYRVRLHFREPWFGKQNGGPGGEGSRVFNVSCNGNQIMENFDILAKGNPETVVKTFDGIQATTGGRIELAFIPVVNYALVNAIEVLPMDKQ